ncbi:hypothetical protein N7449_012115 [Penicillium cf. viridicatum]|uniref:Uncharacterized protein n=1 Tax=Penicillium cf. viridicatum TaxID=2972119 RepID=A0A9W9IPP6_9EURO|nr:hypothetical protein N7449_012115 [Penicillium cf. viridicatum]
MLDEIESCKSGLEKNRHSRIKNGVLNIHSEEIMRVQVEYGPSIHIDHSLFAEQTPEKVLKPKVSSSCRSLEGLYHLSQSTQMPVDYYVDSGESDFSETDLSIRGRNDRNPFYPIRTHIPLTPNGKTAFQRASKASDGYIQRAGNGIKPLRVQRKLYDDSEEGVVWSSQWRAASSVSRESSPCHRDHGLVMDHRMLEKSEVTSTKIWRSGGASRRSSIWGVSSTRPGRRASRRAKSCPPPPSHESRLLHDEEKCNSNKFEEAERGNLGAQVITKEKQNSAEEEEKTKQELEMNKSSVQEWKLEQEHIMQKKARRRHSSTDTSRSDQNHLPRHHSRDNSRAYRSPHSHRLLED